MLAAPGQSNGRALFDGAVAGGNAALGVASQGLVAGAAADFVSLAADTPTLAGKSGDAILDAWIFAGGTRPDCVWVHGKKIVQDGIHMRREAVAKAFKATMLELAASSS